MIAALSGSCRARRPFALVVAAHRRRAWHDALREAGTELHVVAGAPKPRAGARVAAGRRARALLRLGARGHAGARDVARALFWHATRRRSCRRARPPRAAQPREISRARRARRTFVSVSAAIAGELAQLGAPRARIVVVRNEVDAGRFRPPARPSARRARRARFGRSDDPLLRPRSVDQRRRRAGPSARATAGARCSRSRDAGRGARRAGPPRACRGRARRRRRAAALGGGRLAVPSRAEGFALVLLEAASRACPRSRAICPRCGRPRRRPGVHFVPPEDAAALGEAHASPRSRPSVCFGTRGARAGDEGAERWVATSPC